MMDLKAVERRIRRLAPKNNVYIEVVSPPLGDYSGYHATLTRDEAVRLATEEAASDGPEDVTLEADQKGDLLMGIREVN